MLYRPPVTEMVAEVLIPDTVMVLEVIVVLRATSFWSVKLNASGVVSAASVVEVKVSETPPMVNTVSTAVKKFAELVCCTLTVSPLLTVPSALV